MCGYNALQYVRYRHDDNDLVRVGAPAGLPARGAPEAAAGGPDPRPRQAARHLHEVHDLRHRRRSRRCSSCSKLFLGAPVGARCVEVHFPAQLGEPTLYVTAVDAAIKKAVAQFLDSERTPATARARPATSPTAQQNKSGGNGGARSNKPKPTSQRPLRRARRWTTRPSRASATRTRSRSHKHDGKPMIDFPSTTRPSWPRARRSPTTSARSRSTARATTSITATSWSPTSPARLSAWLHGLLRRLGHGLAGRRRSSTNPSETQDDRRHATTCCPTTATACAWSAGRPSRLLLGRQHAAQVARRRARCSRSPTSMREVHGLNARLAQPRSCRGR